MPAVGKQPCTMFGDFIRYFVGISGDCVLVYSVGDCAAAAAAAADAASRVSRQQELARTQTTIRRKALERGRATCGRVDIIGRWCIGAFGVAMSCERWQGQ